MTVAAVGVVCALTIARADTTDDIKNATSLFTHYGRVTIDGLAIEGALIPYANKPGGTLTFDIPASAFGLPGAKFSIHAVGTQIATGTILFTTADTYNPPVLIDDLGETISSESGTFMMTTTQLDGAAAPPCGFVPCVGGTQFRIMNGTIVATGSFGTKVIALDEARGIGGVQRAKANGLFAPPQHLNANGAPELPVCSNAIAKTHQLLRLELGSVAPIGGARVDLSTTSGVQLANTINVPAGRDTAVVDVGVPAGLSGVVSVTAAAGGQQRSTTMSVLPAGGCVAPPARHVIQRMATACFGCSAFGALNNEGDAIIAVNGQVQFAHANTYTALGPLFGATSVGADSINDAGQIAGRITLGKTTQAYRADMRHGAHAPLLLGQMTPMGISQGGVVFGYRDDPKTGLHVPVVNRGTGIVDLALSSPYGVKAARVLFTARDGTLVGTYTGNDNVLRGYKYQTGVTTTLPVINGSPAIPTDVGADGTIAVNAGTTSATISPTGAISYFPIIRGYQPFVVKSINKWGYAVGTAVCAVCTTATTRAFVSIPGTGIVALTGYAGGLTAADDAPAINDDNQVIVHGVVPAIGTPPDYYLLSL
jgi:hypothetical protein